MKTQKIVVMLALFLVLVACSVQQAPKSVVQENLQGARDASLAPLKEFNVEAFQFGFSPAEIHVQKGDHVRIHLTTRDVAHSFSIKEFGINIPASLDTPGVGDFIADKAGSFTWFCRIPCGEGHNDMQGTLVVE